VTEISDTHQTRYLTDQPTSDGSVRLSCLGHRLGPMQCAPPQALPQKEVQTKVTSLLIAKASLPSPDDPSLKPQVNCLSSEGTLLNVKENIMMLLQESHPYRTLHSPFFLSSFLNPRIFTTSTTKIGGRVMLLRACAQALQKTALLLSSRNDWCTFLHGGQVNYIE
jgi:hypothetical protein